MDAFDEMGYIGTHEQRFKQFSEIWKLATTKNKIILSGRPSYFPSDSALREYLMIPSPAKHMNSIRPYSLEVRLEPLDYGRIKAYVARYYPDDVESYMGWIKKNKSVYDLCKRPSMMHIIRDMLPELIKSDMDTSMSATDAMGMYVDHWFERQEHKHVPSVFEAHDPKKKSFIIDFFQDLAEIMYLEGLSKVESSFILESLRHKMRTLDLPVVDRRELIEGFESEILTGYFVEIVGDDYRFVHRSFQEYFVAQRIIGAMQKKNLRHKLVITSDRWSAEIMQFVYEAIPIEFRTDNKVPALLLFTIQNPIRILILTQCAQRTAFMVKLLEEGILRPQIRPMARAALAVLIGMPFALLFILMGKRTTNFVEAAYEVAFVTGQFDVRWRFPFLLIFGSPRTKLPIDCIEGLTLEYLFMYSSVFTGLVLRHTIFKDIRFLRVSFRDISFETVTFTHCYIAETLEFVNCRFTKTLFRDFRYRIEKRNLGFPTIHFAREPHSPEEKTYVRFRGSQPTEFDEVSLASLAELVHRANLIIGRHVQGDDWLMKELEIRVAKANSSS